VAFLSLEKEEIKNRHYFVADGDVYTDESFAQIQLRCFKMMYLSLFSVILFFNNLPIHSEQWQAIRTNPSGIRACNTRFFPKISCIIRAKDSAHYLFLDILGISFVFYGTATGYLCLDFVYDRGFYVSTTGNLALKLIHVTIESTYCTATGDREFSYAYGSP